MALLSKGGVHFMKRFFKDESKNILWSKVYNIRNTKEKSKPSNCQVTPSVCRTWRFNSLCRRHFTVVTCRASPVISYVMSCRGEEICAEDVSRLAFRSQCVGKFIRETKTSPMNFLYIRRRLLIKTAIHWLVIDPVDSAI